MAEPFDPSTALFQIGEDKYGYKYRLTNKRSNGAPIYQCCCSTEANDNANCLWLYQSQDRHWIATEAPKTCRDPVNEGQPKFRTIEQVRNIEEGQWLQWAWFEASSLSWWKDQMGFQTYPIMPLTAPRVISVSSGPSGTTISVVSRAPNEPTQAVAQEAAAQETQQESQREEQ